VSERSWAIRDYEAGDEQAICALFERVFHKSMGTLGSLDDWRWEFVDNPVGPRMIKLAWDGPRLVGHYAVAPRRIWIEGRERLGALSLDSMTDPDYGRQGIFSATGEACYASMAERGFELVYGFPNGNSIAGIERHLGWTMVTSPPVLVKALDLGELAAAKLGVAAASEVFGPLSRAGSRIPGLVDELAQGLRSRVGRGPQLEVVRVDRFGPWVDDLWQRCRDQHRLWAVRDQAFTSWRYDRRPDYDYYRLQVLADGEVVGYLVYTLAERDEGLVAFIMDVVTEPVAGAMEALLRAVEARARIQGARLLSAMAGPATRERRILLRHAYLPLPEALFPKQLHFGGRTFNDLPTSILADRSAWQLGWGDVDVL
jgi:hypothetical protein